MSRFFIAELVPPVDGRTGGARWNGWACPYFTKEQAEQIVAAWNKEWPVCSVVNAEQTALEDSPCAVFDEKTRNFRFYSPDADEWDEFPPRIVDGVEVWDIGAWCWCWELEADALSM